MIYVLPLCLFSENNNCFQSVSVIVILYWGCIKNSHGWWGWRFLRLPPCAYCCILLRPHLTYVSQPKMLVISESYCSQHSCGQNGWMAGGEYRNVYWRRRKHSSSRGWSMGLLSAAPVWHLSLWLGKFFVKCNCVSV